MINLTKVTGTIEFQITDSYTIDKFDNRSAPVKCIGSGTFAAGKKNTSSGGGEANSAGHRPALAGRSWRIHH